MDEEDNRQTGDRVGFPCIAGVGDARCRDDQCVMDALVRGLCRGLPEQTIAQVIAGIESISARELFESLPQRDFASLLVGRYQPAIDYVVRSAGRRRTEQR